MSHVIISRMEVEQDSSPLYSSSSSMVAERSDKDLFRRKERRVKALVKVAEEEIDPKLRKKRAWAAKTELQNQTERQTQNQTQNQTERQTHTQTQTEIETQTQNQTQNQTQTQRVDEESPLSWSEVIDVRAEPLAALLRPTRTLSQCLSSVPHECGCTESVVYELSSCSGFFIIKNALCPAQQLHWAKIAVEEYSRAEHTNLTNLARQKLLEDSISSDEKKTAESVINEDLWSRAISENNNFSSFKKLRWSCLGYHYDWTKRSYQKNLMSIMPENFSALCSVVAEAVGTDLLPEAAIINFYPLNSTMGGHLDDAEHNLEKPIVSFSLGRSALFLIGGKTKLEDPSTVLLTTGDAVVMSGSSRLCYHGVPCILSEKVESHLTSRSARQEIFSERWTGDSRYSDVIKYLRENRLNMNSRQVRLNDAEVWIDKSGTGCVKI